MVSDKQDKTVVVRVERRFTHPVLKKTMRRSKKYHAHDETNQYAIGDIVWIEEHRPISKLKRWAVVQGEKKAEVSVSARFGGHSTRGTGCINDPDADQPRRGG